MKPRRRTAVARARSDAKRFLEAPKTDSSRRTVTLTSLAVEQLKAWKAIQRKDKMAHRDEWPDDDFVFTTREGRPLDHGNMQQGWRGS